MRYRGYPMTLNIIRIDEDPTLPSDQFWTAAADLLIQIASVQPKMGQAIDAMIDDGGDIERGEKGHRMLLAPLHWLPSFRLPRACAGEHAVRICPSGSETPLGGVR